MSIIHGPAHRGNGKDARHFRANFLVDPPRGADIIILGDAVSRLRLAVRLRDLEGSRGTPSER